MTQPTVLLIDGNSLAFRAFYAMYQQVDRMVTRTGLHTNALLAFNRFLEQLVDPMAPDYAVVAWDAGSGRDTFRGELFADYKAGRKATPAEFKEQFPYLREMVQHHGLTNYEQIGLEADDIIGTLSRQAEALGYQVRIVTGDRDLIQLATENITVEVTKKGVTEVVAYTPTLIAETFADLTPAQIIDMKALTGDTSDNYPGVTKIGEKTALKLLTTYHSLAGLYDHVDAMKPSKMKENLLADREQAFRAQKLATIITDGELGLTLADATYEGIQYDAVLALYQQLEFKQAIAKLRTRVAVGEVVADVVPDTAAPTFTWVTAANIGAVPRFQQPIAYHIDTENDNYHTSAAIGFVIGNPTEGYFVGRDVTLLAQAPLAEQLADSHQPKLVFNVKAQQVLAWRHAFDCQGATFDFLLAAYLLDTTDNDNHLATLAARYDVFLPSDADVYGKGAKFAVPTDDTVLANHLVQKAQALHDLQQPVLAALEDHQQYALYTEMELPLASVLAKMEYQGIHLEASHLESMRSELDTAITAVEEQIYAAAGEQINLNSPKQLGVLLFEKMGLPAIKKTKTGYSTAVDVLEKLAPQAPIVADILTYRQLAKVRSTYVEGLLAVIHNDNKIHTRYLQTLTQTGRLSSVAPNLQNIPMRSDVGRQIRKGFLASEPGWQIVSADYSQIELRVLAHMTGDANLQAAFQHNADIHAATARAVFGLASDADMTPNQRRTAKAVNFGIVYGISDFGLANNLGISRDEAKQFITTYFAEFPEVHEWMTAIKATAHEQGYVTTLAHRRRYLPDIHAKNAHTRQFAERMAMNSPIQGSAADIIKIAMIHVNHAIAAAGLHGRMLLQVHDELIFESPADEVDQLQAVITATMAQAMSLKVPLAVDTGAGVSWYDAK